MDLKERLQSNLGDHYSVDRELGGGGMSRVFLATETALGRQIVVKVLPPDSAAQVSIERFKREIKLAASLQHPHIVPLLAAGESHGLPFFTMPFVKGESLRERLVKGGELSVKDTIHILHDVASALAYAHREGIVHRDIKPEYIMLSGGVAVVTDFGVSMAIAAAERGDRPEGDSPKELSITALTALGVALGTPAYMSPEQAAADPHIDQRADIYSFGCVAYELLSGASPFAGRPPQQMLAAHVNDVPDPVVKRRPAVPPALSALVARCLEKRAGDRPQSAEELLAALDAIATPSGGMEPTTAKRAAAARPKRTTWVAVGVAATLIAIALIAWLPRLDRPNRMLRMGLVTPIATSPVLEMSPSISRDGKLVTYVAGSPGTFRVFVKQIDGQRPVLLTGELDGDHTRPEWSPDGSRIAFAAKDAVYSVEALGGTPRLVVRSPNEAQRTPIGLQLQGTSGPSPTWAPDGLRIAYTDPIGIWIKPVATGAPQKIADGPVFHSLKWSPDGQALLYVDGFSPSLGNLSAGKIGVLRLDGRLTPISDSTHVNLSPIWMADGRTVLYLSNRDWAMDIYQQRLDRNLRPDGPAQRITTGLSVRKISISADGTRLAYDVVRNRSNLWEIPIPASGLASFASARQITTENQRIETFSISRDGKWLAFDSDRSGNFDIYTVRVEGGEAVRITKHPGNDFAPSWSPNGRELAFHSSRTTPRRIYTIDADGNNERQVTHEGSDGFVPHWSPDGNQIAYVTAYGADRGDVVIARQADGSWSRPRIITEPTEDAAWPRWSPDGRSIAFAMLIPSAPSVVAIKPVDGGRLRIVARPSPEDGGVFWVTWGPDAGTLYYCTQSPSGRAAFWSVSVNGGTPRLLFRDDDTHRISRADFATDGKRLFLNFAADESDVYVVELRR
jgi:serine/threonine-protein kinase